jgi:hypothetical protein
LSKKVINFGPMRVETDKLKRIKTVAKDAGWSVAYIHKLIKAGKYKVVEIDGMKFILIK